MIKHFNSSILNKEIKQIYALNISICSKLFKKSIFKLNYKLVSDLKSVSQAGNCGIWDFMAQKYLFQSCVHLVC